MDLPGVDGWYWIHTATPASSSSSSSSLSPIPTAPRSKCFKIDSLVSESESSLDASSNVDVFEVGPMSYGKENTIL